tara:strand:- start:3764 stop:5389 length:1626 start_codon:yes stop_codon:yes gene_type:complete
MLNRSLPIFIAIALSLPILTVASSWWNGVGYNAWSHLINTTLTEYMVNTAILSAGVVLGVIFLGGLSAWIISAYRFPGHQFFNVALVLPLSMPGYIVAYTYTGLLDFSGPVQTLMRQSFSLELGTYYFPEIRSIGGAITMLSLVLYPYVYLIARDAFSLQSQNLSISAQMLGVNPIRHFIHISLPIARPAIAAGTALALMETLADYGTVAFFGINVFTTGIFRTWFGLGEPILAMQLASLLLVGVVFVVAYEIHFRKKISFQPTLSTRRKPTKLNGTRAISACVFCALVFACGFFIPFLQLLYWTIAIADQKLTGNYTTLLFNSLSLATITALIAVSLALICSLATRSWRQSRLINVAYFFTKLGYAIPGTIVAIGIIIPFSKIDHVINDWINTIAGHAPGLLISGTLFTVIFAHLVRFVPVAILGMESGISSIATSIDQVSSTLGVSRWKHLKKIQLPILYPSLITSFTLVFLESIKELPATLILRPFNFDTLAVKGFELATDERLADAAPAVITIVIIGLIPIAILSKSISQKYGMNNE